MPATVLTFPSAGADTDDAYAGAEGYTPPRSLTRLKTQFTEAIAAKVDENTEAGEAERYFHGVQWQGKELKILKARNQPPVVFNRIKRKINVVCGIIEKLRTDPKAYARNPQRQAEDGAELATKVVNYVLGWDWRDLSTTVARRGAVRGISGCEMVLTEGDRGDPDIDWDEVDMRDFFYDPRSTRLDFSDARFLGTSRWVDLDEAQTNWPEYEEELESYVEHGPVTDWERGDERDHVGWIAKPEKRVRIVDHWYMVGTQWHYCIYCGNILLECNESILKDERGRSVHKYEMFSAETDQDGDRYGFFRDLKSPQDEINHRRSKALHQLNSRRVIADEGAVDDVETARREYARADGWVVKNPGKEILPDDQQANATVEGNLKMLEEAKAEIDTFGPNPGLIGTDIPAESGRAIQLLQAAGIAELGSFIIAYRSWKLRVYRKSWNAAQQLWQAERWIRVTDDDNMQQFVQVNGWQRDQNGFPQVINQLASLDVDIILDEGPDAVNSMADTFEVIVNLAKGGAQIPPEMVIELAPLPSTTKQRILQQIAAMQQPNPMQQQQIMLQMQLLTAQIQEMQSKVALNQAKGEEALAAAGEKERGDPHQIDTPADLAKARLDMAKAAEIEGRVQSGIFHPPPAPGLFELNQAKARESHARADAAQMGAQMTMQKGEAELGKLFADQNAANANTQYTRAQTAQAMATAGKTVADTHKTLAEARTIDEAPPGMLVKPPPRPPAAKGS